MATIKGASTGILDGLITGIGKERRKTQAMQDAADTADSLSTLFQNPAFGDAFRQASVSAIRAGGDPAVVQSEMFKSAIGVAELEKRGDIESGLLDKRLAGELSAIDHRVKGNIRQTRVTSGIQHKNAVDILEKSNQNTRGLTRLTEQLKQDTASEISRLNMKQERKVMQMKVAADKGNDRRAAKLAKEVADSNNEMRLKITEMTNVPSMLNALGEMRENASRMVAGFSSEENFNPTQVQLWEQEVNDISNDINALLKTSGVRKGAGGRQGGAPAQGGPVSPLPPPVNANEEGGGPDETSGLKELPNIHSDRGVIQANPLVADNYNDFPSVNRAAQEIARTIPGAPAESALQNLSSTDYASLLAADDAVARAMIADVYGTSPSLAGIVDPDILGWNSSFLSPLTTNDGNASLELTPQGEASIEAAVDDFVQRVGQGEEVDEGTEKLLGEIESERKNLERAANEETGSSFNFSALNNAAPLPGPKARMAQRMEVAVPENYIKHNIRDRFEKEIARKTALMDVKRKSQVNRGEEERLNSGAAQKASLEAARTTGGETFQVSPGGVDVRARLEP